MFLKTTKKPNGRITLSVVQGYRDPKTGKSKQRGIKTFDYVDELEKEFDDPIAHFTAVVAKMDKTGKSSEAITQCVQAELNTLSDYTSATFEDTKLQQAAITYINLLYDQLEAAKLYDDDSDGYVTAWKKASSARSILLAQFVSDWGLSVSKDHEKALNELVSSGKSAAREADRDQKVNDLAASIELSFTKDHSVKGTATVKNDTGLDFDNIGLSVEIFDDSGVKTMTSSLNASRWLDGETIVMDCYVRGFEIPANYKIVVDNYTVAS
jgi:hypothetical protein